MTVKIITDSTADLPPEVARELGITVVPVYLRFGEKVYRDGIDMGHDEFYRKLAEGSVQPATSQPAPADFADAYKKLSKESDEMVSIHVTGKLSGTCNAALQGSRELVESGCRIEVMDSLSTSMGLGMIAMAAARSAGAGASLQAVKDEVIEAISRIRLFGIFDTLKYMLRSGRIGKAKALLGSVLNVKPVLAMRDGELVPAGLARTRSRGIDRLFGLVKNAMNIQEMAIVHSTTPDEAASLKERIASVLGRKGVHIARLGPALGVHGGPGALILALREKVSSIRQNAGESEPSKKGFSLPSLHIPKIGFHARGYSPE